MRFSLIDRSIYLILTTLATFTASVGGQQVPEAEKFAAQQTAYRFVEAMLETNDANCVPSELFLPNFIEFSASDQESTMDSGNYDQLSLEERRRLFMIEANAIYFGALHFLTLPPRKYSNSEREALAFKFILPPSLADRVKNTLWRDKKFGFATAAEFRSRLRGVEGVLKEASLYLSSHPPQSNRNFEKNFDNRISGTGLNYRVDAFTCGKGINCWELRGFPEDEKFFRVYTPIFIEVVLVMRYGQMKIVRLSWADDD